MVHITSNFIQKLKLADTNTQQKRYYDTATKGFGIRITKGGVKAYFIEKRIDNKTHRLTIGRWPDLTLEQAKGRAYELFNKIANGINPIAEKQEQQIRSFTLEQVFNDYIATGKSLATRTVAAYRGIVQLYLKDWQHKPIAGITREMVSQKHISIGSHSKAQANLTMQLLGALFTFANMQYTNGIGKALMLDNPVKIISHTQSWYDIPVRSSIIKPHQLAKWYGGVKALGNSTNNKATIVRDYLLLLLFTGLRKEEAARLEWANVDFGNRTLTVAETKNKMSHTLPMSEFVYSLLLERHMNRHNNAAVSDEFVFAGNSINGHLVEPRKQVNRVAEATGISFTLHDLRRTFITVAESLELSGYTLKKLLNHKSGNDVTAGYIVLDSERLRKPMQLITDKLLTLINSTIDSAVVESIMPKLTNTVALAEVGVV